MNRDGELRHWNPRRFFGKRRHRCECGAVIDSETETIRHSRSCRVLWANWTLRARLRQWLLYVIPVGGVTSDGSDEFRPMTFSEHFRALDPALEDDMDLTRYQRFQRRVQRAALDYELNPTGPTPPTWAHLRDRSLLLACEWVVRLRRWVKFLLPFVVVVGAILTILTVLFRS